jgi:hypothetical protein
LKKMLGDAPVKLVSTSVYETPYQGVTYTE